jgi:hypothetical protein
MSTHIRAPCLARFDSGRQGLHPVDRVRQDVLCLVFVLLAPDRSIVGGTDPEAPEAAFRPRAEVDAFLSNGAPGHAVGGLGQAAASHLVDHPTNEMRHGWLRRALALFVKAHRVPYRHMI